MEVFSNWQITLITLYCFFRIFNWKEFKDNKTVCLSHSDWFYTTSWFLIKKKFVKSLITPTLLLLIILLKRDKKRTNNSAFYPLLTPLFTKFLIFNSQGTKSNNKNSSFWTRGFTRSVDVPPRIYSSNEKVASKLSGDITWARSVHRRGEERGK